MSATFAFTWENFSKLAPKIADQLARTVLQQAAWEIQKRWLPYVRAITPIGGALTRDKHPGLAKRSWRVVTVREGVWRLSNLVAHAHILDRGRRHGVTPIGAKSRARAKKGTKLAPNKRARMLGSVQAPQGMTKPTWRRVGKTERAQISQLAIDRAERLVQAGNPGSGG